tara:strand:- start:135 stop:647 length:513 start_codon:yes stop_codon:yes gene_type:complete
MSKHAKNKPENEVNAYLFYAQRVLHLLSSATLIEHQADKMALTASVCLSLKQAWQAWLKELSTYVGKDILDYSELNLPENKSHPEIQLLNDIMKQPTNWLSQLVLFLEPRINTPTVIDTSGEEDLSENVSSSRINLFQLTEDLSEDEKLKRVISEFKTYINSVRSRQAEW